uniref:Zinc finger and SCAN domain containing 4 n=1 Tax=Suricata suricatta TaxID=37032 RepID=A0A673VF71_SURSU
MDLDFRTSFLCDPSTDNRGSGNQDFTPSRGPARQKAEAISEFRDTRHRLFQNGNKSFAKQELQRLYKSFYSWLQPEKHSKDDIIFQVVLEQFMINRHHRDLSTLKEKWESGGRNLEKFMGELSDGCMKPPGLVHVHMQGQEALFSENMPLREVIVHFTKQLSAGTPTAENMGTPFCAPWATSLESGRGDEDKENGGNTDPVNDSIISQDNKIPSLLNFQEEHCPRPEDDSVSLKNPLSSGRAGLGTSGSQEGSLKGPSYQDVLMEVGPGSLSPPIQVTPTPVPSHQHEGTATCEGHQERSQEAPRSYRCEECPRIFRYASQLKAHQRRHNNERPFTCAECNKGFFQASDLHVHQMIHAKKRPYECCECGKSFSRKTHLECDECGNSFSQSSGLLRHRRAHLQSP